MKPDNKAPASRRRAAQSQKFFTLESANRSLVLVRRVVKDIVENYRLLAELRADRDALLISERDGDKLATIRERVEKVADRLRELSEELSEVGCELKDWNTGLIDFPAMHEGRKVLLCWRLGEAAVEHWHELHAGFAGRQPVDASFGRVAPASGDASRKPNGA